MLIDIMVATLTDSFGVGHMGITAENLVAKWGITRDEQDAMAVASHCGTAARGGAAEAITDGRFKPRILSIVKQTRKGARRHRAGRHFLRSPGAANWREQWRVQRRGSALDLAIAHGQGFDQRVLTLVGGAGVAPRERHESSRLVVETTRRL